MFDDDEGEDRAELGSSPTRRNFKLDKVDVAMEPVRLASKSFAESVIEEERKLKTKYDFHPEQQFNIASETSHEIDGLLGTFQKPTPQHANSQKLVPSLQFSSKQPLIRGEVPIDGEFNFS